MKNICRKILFSMMLPAMGGVVSSCQQIDLGDSAGVSNDDTYRVKITSKGGNGESVPLPLTVYAVNDDGLIESKATVTEGGASVNLSLLSGDFTFYAVAGEKASVSDVPENNTITAENGYFENPIMRGKYQTTVDDDTEVPMTLAYAVASVDVTLNEVPDNVTSVSVKIATLREAMNIVGDYEGSTTATLDLEKQSDGTTWKSATAYVFPSVSAPTTLTITEQLSDNTTKSYKASYNAKLVAGTPYHFKGTDTNISNHNLTVSITAEGWDNAIDEELTLTPVESGDGGGSIDADGETFYVSSIPAEAGTVIGDNNKFVLAYVSGNQGLLYAVKDCALDKVAEYKEHGVTGWVVPTLQQYIDINAQATIQNLANAINTINNATKKAGKYQVGDYYYCDDCTNAYSWSSKGSVAIGTSGKTYHLRLVKPVTFVVQ